MAKRVSVCPPGVWCFSSSAGVLLIGLSVLLFVLFIVVINRNSSLSTLFVLPQAPKSSQAPIVIGGGGGDDRYTRAPDPCDFGKQVLIYEELWFHPVLFL